MTLCIHKLLNIQSHLVDWLFPLYTSLKPKYSNASVLGKLILNNNKVLEIA